MDWINSIAECLLIVACAAVGTHFGIRIFGHNTLCDHSPCRLGIKEHPLSLSGASVGANTPEGRIDLAGEVLVCEKCGALYLPEGNRPAPRDHPAEYDGV